MSAPRDLADNRQARRGPRLKATYKVGRTRESKVLQCRRCEARLVALVAHEDDSPAEIAAQARIVVTGGRVAAPFEDVARVEDRAGDEPVACALEVGTDVDDDRAIAHGREGVVDGIRWCPGRRGESGLPDQASRKNMSSSTAHSASPARVARGPNAKGLPRAGSPLRDHSGASAPVAVTTMPPSAGRRRPSAVTRTVMPSRSCGHAMTRVRRRNVPDGSSRRSI